MAIACLRLFTLPPCPDLPRSSVPFFRRCIALFTCLLDDLPYFRRLDFFLDAMVTPVHQFDQSPARRFERLTGGRGGIRIKRRSSGVSNCENRRDIRPSLRRRRSTLRRRTLVLQELRRVSFGVELRRLQHGHAE